MTESHTTIDHPDADQLLKQSVHFDDTVFCLGADSQRLRAELVGLDRQKNLGLRSVLHPTPPWWVVARAYRMARRMVSNEEYLAFWHAPDFASPEDGGAELFIERPDLWATVWEQARIQNLIYHRPPRTAHSGSRTRPEPWVEHYGDQTNVIQAFIKSLEYEACRLFGLSFPAPDFRAKPPEENLKQQDPDRYERDLRQYLTAWVFAGVQWLFRNFYEEEKLVEPARLLFPGGEPGHPAFIEQFLERSEKLEKRIVEITRQNCDPRLRTAFGYKASEVEIVQTLQRIRKVLGNAEAAAEQRARVQDVFFPRSWDTPEGTGTPSRQPASGKLKGLGGGLKGGGAPLAGGGMLKGGQVSWHTRPVRGVSLYESLAYVTWLTQFTYDSGWLVKLPSEAEYERSASWPQHGWEPQAELECRPDAKALFPWEPEPQAGDDPGELKNILDFSAFFGDQAKSLDGYYYQNKARLAQLLEDTARHVQGEDGSPDQIEMLLGFGWQWTEDRYQETETGYNRFENNLQNQRQDIRATQGGQRVPVFDYFAPGFNPDWSFFVCRGAPEIL
ncbi:MAG: SUMF1/EgtB/PvdO family nonheme iron enzyme, partial [Planctomycetota bacterium]